MAYRGKNNVQGQIDIFYNSGFFIGVIRIALTNIITELFLKT